MRFCSKNYWACDGNGCFQWIRRKHLSISIKAWFHPIHQCWILLTKNTHFQCEWTIIPSVFISTLLNRRPFIDSRVLTACFRPISLSGSPEMMFQIHLKVLIFSFLPSLQDTWTSFILVKTCSHPSWSELAPLPPSITSIQALAFPLASEIGPCSPVLLRLQWDSCVKRTHTVTNTLPCCMLTPYYHYFCPSAQTHSKPVVTVSLFRMRVK